MDTKKMKANVAYAKLSKACSKKMEDGEEESLLVVYVRICLIVILYWIVSISMVFMNKLILSDSEYSLDAPLFICWFQCLVTLAITTSLSGLSVLFSRVAITHDYNLERGSKSKNTLLQRFSWLQTLPPLKIELEVMKQIFPLTVFFVGMVTFNNLCLKHVGVAFYFVGRSLTTVFNVIFTFIILGQSTSRSAIVCCLAIVAGFFLGADQEKLAGSLSMSGVLFGVLASIFVSLNSIFTVNGLKVVDGNIWTLTIYNNLLACILFVPCIVVNEEIVVLSSNVTLLSEPAFWSLMLWSGVFGFLIGYVTNLQIKFTSPLTHNISGTAKACAQTILATHYYQQSKTFAWWLSNFMVLAASAIYTRIRQLEMASKHRTNTSSSHKDASLSVKLLPAKSEQV